MKPSKSLLTLLLATAVAVSAIAQAPAPAQNAPAGGPPGGGAGRGGGRGAAAPTPTLSAEQYLALAKWNFNAQTQAATAAVNALREASLKGGTAADLKAKADAVGAAELTLATAKAEALSAIQSSPNKFNAEQLAFVRQNGGLNRPGNSSPGGTIAYDDYSGFTALWDGKTLTNWDGESDVWSIENGAIHADTVKTPGQHHLHYVGPDPVFKDFDLKVEVKLGGAQANGGLQYRGTLVNGHGPNNTSRSHADPATKANPMGIPLPAGVTTVAAAQAKGITGNPWQLGGYQFDMNTGNNYTGQLYENQGRGIVTAPGQYVQLAPGGLRFIIATAADNPVQYIKEHKGFDGEWNQFEVIARGNVLTHLINGHVISVTVDDDPTLRTMSGIMSLQLEGSGQIWYRNIYLKRL